MSRTLDLIREEIELEGFEPGSPEFERNLLERRVLRCQEMQEVPDCTECRAFISCELAREYMIQKKYGGPRK